MKRIFPRPADGRLFKLVGTIVLLSGSAWHGPSVASCLAGETGESKSAPARPLDEHSPKLAAELAWSVRAHEYFLSQPHDPIPIYAEVSFAKLYIHFGEFENAKSHLDIALANLPGPPWRTMREAELHDTLSDLYSAWGRTDEAQSHYDKAIALYPTAKPPYGRHLLPRRAQQIRTKRELLSFDSLDQQRLKDGTYKEQALGYSGDIQLTVTVRQSRVADIKVGHQEKIDQNACVSVPRQIVQRQSLHVDAVSGATVSKNASVSGTYRALQRAGLK